MNKFSLRFKLLSVVGLLSICCLAIAGWGLFEMDKAQDRLNFIVKTVSVRLGQWTEIRDYQRVLSLRERDLLMADTPEERKKAEKQLETYKSKIDETIKQYLPIALDEGKAKAGEFSDFLNAWWATNLKVRELLDRGDREAAEALVRGLGLENRNKALAIQEALVEMNQNIMAAEVKSAEAEHTRASAIMLVFAIAAAVSASAIGIWMVRQITRTIEAVIASLQENSNQVSVASQQIASASENLSQASTEQAASLQETAATMAEVSSMVARNTESAARTSEVSSTSQSTAQRGQRVVEDMTKAISEINQSNDEIVAAVAESNRQMGEITRVIGEIGEKTKVINDIVFQTKLLSFNASVEAARAGEHGKGFSVVAEEVGNLAAMSGNAAKEISGMLESSLQTVNSIAERTKQNVDRLVQVGKQKVDTGMRIAEECSAVLSEIVGLVTEVAQMSGDISQASREQATGVEEINKAMGELDKVTQINASAAEEASASARALSSQAETLQANVVALIEAIRGADDVEKPASPVKSPKVEKAVKSKPATQLKVVVGSAGGSKAVSAASKTKIKASEPKSAAVPLKQAAGGDFKVPTEDDPRFSDI